MVVLDGDGAPMAGASYSSSVAEVVQKGARSESVPIDISDDSDTSSDDCALPFYPCTQ